MMTELGQVHSYIFYTVVVTDIQFMKFIMLYTNYDVPMPMFWGV